MGKKEKNMKRVFFRDKISWSPNSTYLHLDFYLLSWRWWPLWSGGLLFQLPVLPEKASQVQFIFKISVSCPSRMTGDKKMRRILGKILQKNCLFQASPSFSQFGLRWGTPNQDKLSLAWDGAPQIRTNWVWPEMGHPESGQTEFGFFEKHFLRYLFNVNVSRLIKQLIFLFTNF